MAHLNPDYNELQELMAGADQVYTADLASLNNSGVSGTVFAILNGDQLTVTVIAEGTAKGQIHPQHIHGRFDENGQPMNSVIPTLFDDADGDGFIETLEGVPAYGDIILPLVAPAGNVPDGFPVSDASGDLFYSFTYDLNNSDAFFSPVTGAEYEGEDLVPLFLREYVMHGVVIPDGYGAGTDGEVNGEGGYIQLLPNSNGDFVEVSSEEAQQLLSTYEDDFRNVVTAEGDGGENLVGATENDNFILGGGGNDRIVGQEGEDSLTGGDGNDRILAGSGDDFVLGGGGNDRSFGGEGEDTYVVQGFSGEYRLADLGEGEFAIINVMTGERDYLEDFEAIEFYDSTFQIEDPETPPGAEDAPITGGEMNIAMDAAPAADDAMFG